MKKIIYSLFIITFTLNVSFSYAGNINKVLSNSKKNPKFELFFENLEVLANDSISKTNNKDTVSIQEKRATPIRLTQKTENYIKFLTSNAGSTEIKLLPMINNSEIVLVNTSAYGKEMSVSDISFYSTEWEKVDGNGLIPTPQIAWFIDLNSLPEDLRNEFTELSKGLNPISWEVNPEDFTITAKSELKYFLGDEYAKFEEYLNESKKLNWNKTSFVLAEN